MIGGIVIIIKYSINSFDNKIADTKGIIHINTKDAATQSLEVT